MAKRQKPADNDQIPVASPESSRDASPGLDDRSPDRIAARAYELYLERGGSDGQDFDDWLAAERELSPGRSRGDEGE